MKVDDGRGGSRLWLLVLMLTLVLSVFTAISTMQQRQRMADMVDQLGDTSATARAEAIDYLFNGSAYESGRLADSPRALRLLEDASASFSDAALAQLFDEVIEPRAGQWYELAYHAPLTFHRSISAAVRLHPTDLEKRRSALAKFDMALHSGQREAGYGVVWDVADQTERELILETSRVFIEAYANDWAAGPENGFYTALSLIGEPAVPLIEPLLNARSDEVQREAWLVIGLLDSGIGSDAEWREAPPLVAEAMITSAVIRSADPDGSIERFRAQVEAGSALADVLDALSGLSRDGQGRIDLDADPPQTTPAPRLLAELYGARQRVRYAETRLESFREMHGYAID
jgi:hypothetical protein